MIYIDNAATTIHKPQSVYDAVIYAMKNYGNSGRGYGKTSLEASRCIFEARKCLTEFFGGDDESGLIFTSNATEALNTVIHGLFNEGDRVITTNLEHNSVLRPLYYAAERGVKTDIVSCRDNGIFDAVSNPNGVRIEDMITKDTKAIICTHASNLTGNVVDIKRIGEIAKKHNLLFIVDASQTAGVLPINVKDMKIDILCFTGHKSLMGPQGTGGFYIRKGIDIRPLKSGGTGIKSFLRQQPEELPERLEAGTLNSHGIAGLLVAVKEINAVGIDEIYNKENRLMQMFYSEVSQVKGIKVYGDFRQGKVRCPIVSLNIGTADSSEISMLLDDEFGIVTRAGIHCAPLMHEYFGTKAQGMVRFSFSYYNTEEEVTMAIDAVKEIAKKVVDI